MRWIKKLRSGAVEQPGTVERPELLAACSTFTIHVIFTTWPGTLAALRMAAQQTQSLGARIVIWCFQVVPRQFTATSPPVSTRFVEQQMRSMVKKYCQNMEVEIRMCLCTNQENCMRRVFTPETVVLAGGRKRWWPTREQRTAQLLESHGCRVLFVTSGPQPSGTPGAGRNRSRAA